MTGLLAAPARYVQMLYLTAPPARPIVTRSAGRLPADWRDWIIIRDLPPAASTPQAAAS